MKKIFYLFFALFVIFLSCSACGNTAPVQPTPASTEILSPSPTFGPTPTAAQPAETAQEEPAATPEEKEAGSSAAADGVLLGMYPSGFLRYYVEDVIEVDQWMAPTGKRHAVAATFMDFEDPDLEEHIPNELDAAWDHGYIPFVNLSAGNLDTHWTAEEIAQGELDQAIETWASLYAAWSREGEKRAFLAPLQEMNGSWTTYGLDPENFKLAYRRIQDIFYQQGVSPRAVSWVFAPNGWSLEEHRFELYYPGDERVDVVGFSSFNFGQCSNWPAWQTYQDIFQPYLERMSAMAPEKPIFIAELGTVAEGGDKDQWLQNTYAQLSTYPNLRGILYFNRGEFGDSLPNCPRGADYRIYNLDKDQGYLGFLEGISSPNFVYYPPQSPEMGEIMFSRPAAEDK